MQRFKAFVQAILAVPKEVILEAEAEHRRKSSRVKAATKKKLQKRTEAKKKQATPSR